MPRMNKCWTILNSLLKHCTVKGLSPLSLQIVLSFFFSIEITTDSLKYIYEFGINEKRIKDTLLKYALNEEGILDIITQMRSIQCTWINNLDYYVDQEKHSLVFISMRPVELSKPFTNKKYYIITYFSQPQYFDNEGKLLVKKQMKRTRKINGEIFWRINDKVCYTISARFRWFDHLLPQ